MDERDLDPRDVAAIREGCAEGVRLCGGYSKAAGLLEIAVGSLHNSCKQDDARLLTVPEIALLQASIGADPVTKIMSDLALRGAAPHEPLSAHDRLEQVWPRMRELEQALLRGHRSRALKAIGDLNVELHRARWDWLGDGAPKPAGEAS